jgi:hypothetical protein
MSLALALSQTQAKQNWRLSMEIDEALRLVRDDLASGKIPASQFDMGRSLSHSGCGTVGCIGGWAYLKMHGKKNAHKRVDGFIYHTTDELHALFFPSSSRKDIDWSAITPAHAVKAIDMYLTTGKVDWLKAMESEHV